MNCPPKVAVGLLPAVLLLGIAATAADDDDVQERLARMPGLVVQNDRAAAEVLARLMEKDPVLHVRVAAARGLGQMREPHAAELLVSHVARGGPWALRQAVTDALDRHVDVAPLLLDALDERRRSPRERLLLVRALGILGDEASRERLRLLRADADDALRDAALRALALRKDDVEERNAYFVDLLSEPDQVLYVREVLDVLEPALDPSMTKVLSRLEGHREADIAHEAKRLLALLSQPKPAAPAAAPGGVNGRYAKQDPPRTPTDPVPPTPPPLVGRYDLAVAFDASGSAHFLIQEVLRRTRATVNALRAQGTSLRIGVVVFRGGHGRRERMANIDVLPLTYDVEHALVFIEEAEARGADDRGAAVTEGLREALDLMVWRWNASRQVHLYADSGCDDMTATKPRVAQHASADGTKTAVAWYARTRGRTPEDLEALAKAGGAGRLEILE